MGKPTGRNGREHMSQSGTRASFKRPLVESQIVKSFHYCSTRRGSLPGSTSTVLKNVRCTARRKIAASDACPSRTAPRKSERSIPGSRSAPEDRRACCRHSNRRPILRFVNGGILPVGLAARWMADVWDQNTVHYVMSPINSRLEEICERWIVSLLGFPEETAAGFVSGTTIANFSGLCAG